MSLVAGDTMTIPLWEFERACERLIADEQEKIAPDNHLISTLCEAVRLSREYVRWAKSPIGTPAPLGETCENCGGMGEFKPYGYGQHCPICGGTGKRGDSQREGTR